MPPVGFEPAIPACHRSQAHALDSAAIGIGFINASQSDEALEILYVI
jgi:hypothetical protein